MDCINTCSDAFLIKERNTLYYINWEGRSIKNPNMKKYLNKTKGVKNKFAIGLRSLSSGKRILPDFLVIGGKRCGTTFLYNNLVKHPNLHPPFLKEIHFFDRFYHKGLKWYRSHFPSMVEKEDYTKKGFIYKTGEGSTSYIYYDAVPQRIKQTLPDVKIIALLRNPIDRAFSHYQDEVKREWETLPFEKALEAEEGRLANPSPEMVGGSNELERHRFHFSYKDRGLYARQLKAWSEVFPIKDMHIIRSEDLFKNTSVEFEKVVRFLGFPDWMPQGFKASDRGEEKAMDPNTRKQLAEYFRPHNEELAKLLGRDLGWD